MPMISKVREAPAAKPEPEGPLWWDQMAPTHPLSDDEFCKLYCHYVLLHTTDHTLRIVRERTYRFIRSFMANELRRELTRYRAHQPL